jgi:hypothetical protein
MDHPAVEIKLPLDGETHRAEIPRETTLFFWGGVAPGSADHPQTQDQWRASQQRATRALSEHGSWTITIAGESKPLLDEPYRVQGESARAWWIACDPVELPTTVEIEFASQGEPPTIDGSPATVRTEQGESAEWGSTLESTIELVPSTSQPAAFQTREEQLWNRHTVYLPRWDSPTDGSPPDTGRSSSETTDFPS